MACALCSQGIVGPDPSRAALGIVRTPGRLIGLLQSSAIDEVSRVKRIA